MTEHLGHDPATHKARPWGKTVIIDIVRPIQIEVTRDLGVAFKPVILRKRQRRLSDLDQDATGEEPPTTEIFRISIPATVP